MERSTLSYEPVVPRILALQHVFERRSPGAHSLAEQEEALKQGKPLHSADGTASCPEDPEPRGAVEEFFAWWSEAPSYPMSR